MKKELSLFGVYAIATGTTLSAGFFLLPGLAFAEAGPAVIVSYLVAAAMMVPAMLCIVELATAMPRAGGTYFFLDRSLGPLAGMIGGLGTWLALTLKSAFALVGMGVYLSLFLEDPPVELIATLLAAGFGFLNLLGAKGTGRFQMVLVLGLLSILAWFILKGVLRIHPEHFTNFLGEGGGAILSTAGLVFISYVGVTKVASIAEEVRNPERNLPIGVFLALGTAVLIYALGLVVMVGLIDPEVFKGSLTPVAKAAESMAGRTGMVVVSFAAILAFSSVANAGILSSSRYPMAMSRDHLLPRPFRSITRFGTPGISILVTVAMIVLVLNTLNVTDIVKLASAFQLLMFAMLCLAVVVMRESGIGSYDPGWRSPFYPWLQIVGFLAPCWLIIEMGWLPSVFAAGLVILGIAWFFAYAAGRVTRHGAIYHVFERLGQQRFEGLDSELRGILKEKGLRANDPFDEIVAATDVIDARSKVDFQDVVESASALLAKRVGASAERLAAGFLDGTRIGATPVTKHVALPHLRLHGLDRPRMVIVRSRAGIEIEVGDAMKSGRDRLRVHAIFFLVSPEDDPGQHLRLLAQLAGCVEQEGFAEAWDQAQHQQQLREVLLRDDRYLALVLDESTASAPLIDLMVRETGFPEGCLLALIRRKGRMLVPKAFTTLQAGDRLTIIGDVEGIAKLTALYQGDTPPHDAPQSPPNSS